VEGTQRLDLPDEARRPTTTELFELAGIWSGAHCLDAATFLGRSGQSPLLG